MVKNKAYTFTHENNATETEISTAYQIALDFIAYDDGGTPLMTNSYKRGGNWYVTIIYKSAT